MEHHHSLSLFLCLPLYLSLYLSLIPMLVCTICGCVECGRGCGGGGCHSKLTQAGRTTIDRRNNNGFGAFASLALGVLLMALHAHRYTNTHTCTRTHSHTPSEAYKINNLVAMQRGQTIRVRTDDDESRPVEVKDVCWDKPNPRRKRKCKCMVSCSSAVIVCV